MRKIFKKFLIFIPCVLFLLFACDFSESHLKEPEGSPVAWLTIEGKKYNYFEAHISMDKDTLINTDTVTDPDDGKEPGHEIYKSTEIEDSYFLYESFQWVEYKLRE